MSRIQPRRGPAAEWASVNTLLAEGEIGIESNTGLFKIGDGIRAWNSLPYAADPNEEPSTTIVSSTASYTVDLGICQSELAHGGYTGFENETKVREVLQGIQDLGGKRVRVAGWWNVLEPVDEGGYVWTGMDRFLTLAKEYHLEPLVCITSPAPTGVSIADFGQLCGAVAGRYGPSGTGGRANLLNDFELWNEINHRDFAAPFGTGSAFAPATYVSLLQAASPAIRAANPNATIVSVGLMSTVDYPPNDILPSTYLQGIYAAGGKGLFDAVGFHWYSGTADFTAWEEPSKDQLYYKDLLAVRQVMVTNGDDDLKVWVTEFGFSRNDQLADVDVKTEWLLEQLELLIDLPWVGPVFLYQYKDSADGEPAGSSYGLVDFNLVKRQPVWDAVANVNRASPRTWKDSVTSANLRIASGRGTAGVLNVSADGVFSIAPDAVGGGGGGGGGNDARIATAGADLGNGTTGPFVWNHGMNSFDLNPVVRTKGGSRQNILVDFEFTTSNTITFKPTVVWPAGGIHVSAVGTLNTSDLTAPTPPTVAYSAKTSTQVTISASGGSDASGVVGYRFYRGGALQGSINGSGTYTFVGLTANTTYSTLGASAVDIEGNESSVALLASPVTTDASGPVVLAGVGLVPAYTGNNQNYQAGTQQITFTGGPNTLLLCGIFGGFGGGSDMDTVVTSLTSSDSSVGSLALLPNSKIYQGGGTTGAGGQGLTWYYKLGNLTGGTQTLTMTGASANWGSVLILAYAFSNVGSIGTPVRGGSGSTAPSLTVSSAPNDMVATAFIASGALTGYNGTVDRSYVVNGSMQFFVGHNAGASTVTPSCTNTGIPWGGTAIPLVKAV